MKLQRLFIIILILANFGPLTAMHVAYTVEYLERKKAMQPTYELEALLESAMAHEFQGVVDNFWSQKAIQAFIKQVADLLKNGANPNGTIKLNPANPIIFLPGTRGTQLSFLKYAILLGYPEVVRLLLDAGAINAADVLTFAVESTNLKKEYNADIIALLIDRSPHLDQDNKDKIFFWIVKRGTPELVQLMLPKLVTNINRQDPHGQIPLMNAEDPRIVQVLLDAGADPTVRDIQGFNTVDEALYDENWEKLRVLLENGIDPNMQTHGSHGSTPLAYLSQAFTPTNLPNDPAHMLLEFGALPNLQTTNGNTALIIAAGVNNEPMVRLLLEYGADQDIANKSGKTPLSVAQQNQFQGIIDLLQNPPPLKRIKKKL